MWFKVDDKFHSHPKVVEAGNAAIGLWVRCASWSAEHLTDGHIPTAIRQQFDRKRTADRLIEVGLWVAEEDGYFITDFLDYNPSAQEVRLRRKIDAERKRAGR